MTQRNELCGPLRGHDAGDARRLQGVALAHPAGADRAHGARRHDDTALRHGLPRRDRLVADVDHPHATPGIDVRQSRALGQD